MVFSDNIFCLQYYAKMMKRPFIYGRTNFEERKICLNLFNKSPRHNCLFISSVGDTSIDLPDVNVLIQISSHFSSRRQEAQRLGRILRPKPKQGEEYNAFFYSLISKDTKEIVYSTKRKQFLMDQGYSVNVVTDIINLTKGGLMFEKKEDQERLLEKILEMKQDILENLQEENLNVDLCFSERDKQKKRKQKIENNILDVLTVINTIPTVLLIKHLINC